MEMIDMHTFWSDVGEMSVVCTYRVIDDSLRTHFEELGSTIASSTATIEFHGVVSFQVNAVMYDGARDLVMNWFIFPFDGSTTIYNLRSIGFVINPVCNHHFIHYFSGTTFDIVSRQAVLLEEMY